MMMMVYGMHHLFVGVTFSKSRIFHSFFMGVIL
jgi:hypothetical protein